MERATRTSRNLIQEGRYEEARRISGQALRTAEQIEHSGLRVAVTLNQIGLLHSYLGDYSQAEKAYLHGIRLFENCACESLLFVPITRRSRVALSSREHPWRTSRAASSPGARFAHFGTWVGAPRCRHPAIESGRNCYDPAPFSGSADTLPESAHDFGSSSGFLRCNIAGVLANRAVLSFHFGRFPDALNDLTRAVAMYEKALGVRHPKLVRPLINLASMYLGLDRAALAEAPLGRAMSIMRWALMNQPVEDAVAPAWDLLSAHATAKVAVARSGA